MKHLIRVCLFILCIFLTLPNFSSAQDDDFSQVRLNYIDVIETGDKQRLDVYFTPLNENFQPINIGENAEAQIVLENQGFTAEITAPSTPINIVLVLDISGSMKPSSEVLRKAAVNAVNIAPQGSSFAVITFNEEILVRSDLSVDRESAKNAINAITDEQFEKGTCLYDATELGLSLLSEGSAVTGRRAVIVFTDGRDELIAGGDLDPCSEATVEELLVTANNPARPIPIYTIGLGGSQDINVVELQSLAINTGGFFVTDTATNLSLAFQQIMDALNSQRIASFEVCLEDGDYSGFITFAGVPSPIPEITFNSSCVVPTATPTTIPSQLTAGKIQQDGDFIVFTIGYSGEIPLNYYRVQITNTETGLIIPSDYGEFPVLKDDTIVRIPVSAIDADKSQVTLQAIGNDEQVLVEIPVGGAISPEKTETPTQTPTPTDTLTPTPIPTDTPTPTATPINYEVAISSIKYDGNKYTLRLNVPVDPQIIGYTVMIMDNNRQEVYNNTSRVPPEDIITISESNDIKEELAPGVQYQFHLELLVEDAVPGQVRPAADYQYTKPIPEKESATTTLITNLSSNPLCIGGLLLATFGVFFFVVTRFFIAPRQRKKQINQPIYPGRSAAATPSEPKPKKPARNRERVGTDISAGDEDTGQVVALKGSEPVQLTLIQAPHLNSSAQKKEWQIDSLRTPAIIGRTPNEKAVVSIVIRDTQISSVHATIRYEGGTYYVIDENSRHGTFLNEHLLNSNQTYKIPAKGYSSIRLGPDSELRFEYLKEIEDRNTRRSAKIVVVETADEPLLGKPVTVHPRHTPENPFTIGRDEKNSLTIDDGSVSSEHLAVVWHQDSQRFLIQDVKGSTNGSYLKQPEGSFKKLKARKLYPLEPNQAHSIRLGNTEFVLEYQRDS